ncbi:MAG: glycosyltransferase family 2 protein [Limisphaerales bacterium]
MAPQVDPPKRVGLSILIPCCNEAEVLPSLQARLLSCLTDLGFAWEAILIDDGSVDNTYELLAAMHRADPRFKVVGLSRNFGHQAAIGAGLAFASGDAIGILDADLQDPLEVLVQAFHKLSEGYDVVYAVRRKRKENLVKRAAYALFYRILSFAAEVDIPLDSGDFCVMTRRVATVLRQMPERNVFLRGLRAWSGFRQIGLEYERSARAAGETKYQFKKLLRLAADGIFAFSLLPLRLATYLGLCALGCSVSAGVFVLIWRLCGFRFMGYTAHDLPGWTAISGGLLFMGGVQFLMLGCLGEYIGRIYTEVKQRPRWIVREALGIEPNAQPCDPEGWL